MQPGGSMMPWPGVVRSLVFLGALAVSWTMPVQHAAAARWTIVPTPTNGAGRFGVAASSPSTVWGFGFGVWHWAGGRWQKTATPVQVFRAGVVESPTEAWAAGATPAGPDSHGVIVHWDGKAWRVALRQKRRSDLTGISRVPGTQRFWAVGTRFGGGHIEPVIRHRGARGWHPVAGANVSSGWLTSVASKARVSWAVGHYNSGGALVERWAGHRWVMTPVPNGARVFLNSVAVVKGHPQAWAVGYRRVHSDHHPVAYLWSRRSWHEIPIDLGQQLGELDGVVSIRHGEAWAVGVYYGPGSTSCCTLIEHWTVGPSWQRVPSPTPRNGCGWTLHAIAKVPRTRGPTLWTVGDEGCSFRTVSERYR